MEKAYFHFLVPGFRLFLSWMSHFSSSRLTPRRSLTSLGCLVKQKSHTLVLRSLSLTRKIPQLSQKSAIALVLIRGVYGESRRIKNQFLKLNINTIPGNVKDFLDYFLFLLGFRFAALSRTRTRYLSSVINSETSSNSR
jgi:hypothetical protein